MFTPGDQSFLVPFETLLAWQFAYDREGPVAGFTRGPLHISVEGEVQDPSTATNLLTSYQLQSLLFIEYLPSTQITACRDLLPQPKNHAAGVTPTTYTLKADLLDEAGAARFFHPGQNIHYLDRLQRRLQDTHRQQRGHPVGHPDE